MKKKVTLSVQVSPEARKLLRRIALDEDKTMATLLEEMIIIKWQNTDNKHGTI